MGDMGDMYRDWKSAKKARSLQRSDRNWHIITEWLEKDKTKLRFIREYSGNIQFHFPGKPKIDFYPTKNKWRKGKVIYYGDAKKLLEWYENQ